MFLFDRLELDKYSFIPNEFADVSKTHLFISLDRAEYCFELSYEYRNERLRREFIIKYILNKDGLFKWHPQDTLAEILGCDLTGYAWQLGDPGMWLAGRHLANYSAIPTNERSTLHLAFRSVKEIETIFYAFIDHSFFSALRNKNYKKIKMMKNRLSGLIERFENRQTLI